MIWIVGLGGALGAVARFLLGKFINGRSNGLFGFPLATLVINISGSFLLGVIVNLHMQGQMDEWLWLFLGVGFCGAYTTFSTFGYETIMLIEAKKTNLALLYVTSSIVVGVIAAAIGFII
ncbi:MAG TPA: fluoride efflux transporter CrcB [Bacillus bacterium]|nr:fluoride efflux transporter CrcB [Bacillus sp. (in: firmicutes)]